MKVRTRLLLASLVTLAAGLGILIVLGNLLFAGSIDGQIRGLLATRADAQIAALDVRPTGVSVRQTHNDEALDAQAWIFDGAHLLERAEGLPAGVDQAAIALGASAAAPRTRTTGQYRLRLVPLFAGSSRRRVGAVVVELDVAPFDSLRDRVLLGSFAIAGIILLVVGLAVDRALRAALDPVRTMTDAAADWSEHDLDRRFGLPAPRDEIGGLAVTLDRLLDRIAASRRHERRFAADVAHELRTPLATIQGRVELALDPRESAGAHVRALRLVEAQAARMTATVDALLAVARAETDPEDGRVDLAAIARDFDGVEVTVHPGLAPAEGEPELVRRALAPLVENARRYARSRVRIELGSHDGRSRATVRDDGPGLDPELGDAAFAPGRRGAGAPEGGAGLGLPLARRLARACGGEVSAGAGPGGCFILELPEVRADRHPAAGGEEARAPSPPRQPRTPTERP